MDKPAHHKANLKAGILPDIRLLFITRKFPPMVGGMEKLSFALAKEFSKQVNTTIITWGKSQKYLPFVYLLFLIKAIYLIPTKKITHIHIGDALLSPLGLFLKTTFGLKTTITVVGLDVTFNFPGYQFLIPRCLKRLDKIVCISDATREECLRRGIPSEKCVVIPCGVYPEEWRVKATRKDLGKIVGRNLQNKKVIITVGRLVKRKGVYWFIENVLPKLDTNFIYLVVGGGPEEERIKGVVHRLRLENQVFLLGKIPDYDLKVIYNTSDFFVMPNIKVKNSVEGFGIVAIEASSVGLPVIASNTEGISDSIKNGKNGLLVDSGSEQQFIDNLTQIKLNKKSVIDYTKSKYSWGSIIDNYIFSIK